MGISFNQKLEAHFNVTLNIVASSHIIVGLVEQLIKRRLFAGIFLYYFDTVMQNCQCFLLIALIHLLGSFICHLAIPDQVLVSLAKVAFTLIHLDFFFEFEQWLGCRHWSTHGPTVQFTWTLLALSLASLFCTHWSVDRRWNGSVFLKSYRFVFGLNILLLATGRVQRRRWCNGTASFNIIFLRSCLLRFSLEGTTLRNPISYSVIQWID